MPIEADGEHPKNIFFSIKKEQIPQKLHYPLKMREEKETEAAREELEALIIRAEGIIDRAQSVLGFARSGESSGDLPEEINDRFNANLAQFYPELVQKGENEEMKKRISELEEENRDLVEMKNSAETWALLYQVGAV